MDQQLLETDSYTNERRMTLEEDAYETFHLNTHDERRETILLKQIEDELKNADYGNLDFE